MSHVYAPLEQRQLLANAALVIAATGVAVQCKRPAASSFCYFLVHA